MGVEDVEDFPPKVIVLQGGKWKPELWNQLPRVFYETKEIEITETCIE